MRFFDVLGSLCADAPSGRVKGARFEWLFAGWLISNRIIRKPDRSASACPGCLKLRDDFRGECGNHRFAAVYLPDFLPDIRIA